MTRERRGLFARSGIDPLTPVKVLLVVVLAFAIGVGAGWFSTQVPGYYRGLTEPEPSHSPSVTPSPIPSLSVEPSAQPAIARDLDTDDAEAGIVDIDVPYRAEETFTAVAGTEEASGDALATRWVRIEVEDGLDVNAYKLSEFVMDTLNDNRGWGTDNTIEFLRTDGVPDARIVIASPRTAAALCSDPRSGLASGPVVEGSVEPSQSADEDLDVDSVASSCAAAGIMVVSLYDWTAGVESYDDARQDSRRYLLTHFAGTLLGHSQEKCGKGLASVMVDQASMKKSCKVNPWAYPDADPSPSAGPAASASAASS
ncbi:DUF3152 domain-containing protein [Demequina sp. NBRC 110054]|uniref:DUF3152 domain-containing protein n=1 Tax=Demequina sp. NBRC 110054 TaxID=1570343 RepID=UPI000A01DCE2|nr:DUF3152 domain-containing protein [Demequina sp. NBRC 110054]